MLIDKHGIGKYLAFATILIICDQLSKWLAVRALHKVYSTEVFSFLNFTLAYNKGASFSFLADSGGWQRWLFLVISLIASIWLFRLIKQHKDNIYFSVALSLILAGAIGNFIDRLLLGAVIDFIHVHWQNLWHFPIFNLADSCITCGGILAVFTYKDLPKSQEI